MNDGDDRSPSRSRGPTSQWLAMLAAVITLAAALVGIAGRSTIWLWVIVLIFPALVIGPILWPRVKAVVSSRRKMNEIGTLWPEFEAFVETLSDWSEPNRLSLHYHIRELVQGASQVEGSLYRTPHPWTLNEVMFTAKPILLGRPTDLNGLGLNVRLFEAIIGVMEREFVDGPLEFIAKQARGSPFREPSQLAKLRKYYPVYQGFMMDYAAWAKRLNGVAGGRVSWRESYIPGPVDPREL